MKDKSSGKGIISKLLRVVKKPTLHYPPGIIFLIVLEVV